MALKIKSKCNSHIVNQIYSYEQSLPKNQRKELGITYTPQFIVDYINNELLSRVDFKEGFQVIDPSCGAGTFLIDLIYKIKAITNESYKQIIENRVYGIDYDEQSIILLNELLKGLVEEEGKTLEKTNIVYGNSLDRSFFKSYINDKKFDIVCGNPPYIKIQNIPKSERRFLDQWSFIQGNTDTYIPFYQLAFELLKPEGVGGYISSNTFLKTKSGKKLCQHLLDEKMMFELVNFKDNKIFKNLNTYTCICLFSKSPNESYTYKEPTNNKNNSFKEMNCCKKTYPVPLEEATILNKHLKTIKSIESAKYTLSNITDIRVGLATLADDVYFFDRFLNQGDYIWFGEDILLGKEKIETEILKPCIKVNSMIMGYIIFPYKKINGKYIPMQEKDIAKYPHAYSYLQKHKKRLLKRDRGKIKPDQWFLYGRSQGINSLWGEKLLTPTLSLNPKFIECQEKEWLYLSGYGVFLKEKSPYDLSTLQRILSSEIMAFYIDKKSKKMQSGWSVYSKEFLKNFSIPEFNQKEIEFINYADEEILNKFLFETYKKAF